MKDLWVPISGAIAQQKNVETIANNVANANTPGFKKDQLIFKEHLTAFEKGTDINLPKKEWAPDDFYKSYGAEKAFVKIDGSYTDFKQGQLSPTGNQFDIALNGPGFFEILTPNGIRYSRRGSFSLDAGGKLVTDQGMTVLSKVELPEVGAGNDLINAIKQIPNPKERGIQLDSGKISVNLQGEIFLNNKKVGALSVVEFNDIQALKKEGGSYYINADTQNINKKEAKTSIHQGFVEQSNVNAIHEMSKLIKANRQFESIMKVIKAYDNVAGRAVNDIARF